MSRLDELLQELCPDGVEYGKIGDLVDYEQPSKYIVSSTNYNDDYDVPVLTAGQSFILGYTDETDGICEASKDNPVIIFDDFTGAFKWVDFPFKVKSSAMKILRPKLDVAVFRYVFHLMGWLNYTSSEHKRLWIGIYSEFEVPVPPLEVQREIVRILDKFTQLRAELSAELSARRIQYEHYRNKLFMFGEDVPIVKFTDVINSISSGKNKLKSTDGTFPVYGSTGEIGRTDNAVYSGKRILVARVGANAGFVYVVDGEYDVSDNTLMIDVKDEMNFQYVYQMLVNMNLNKLAKGGGQPLVTAGDLRKIDVYNPSYGVQCRVADILEKFAMVCNDISSGLPAEIEARTKQYEFYRDKLLSFKRKEAS